MIILASFDTFWSGLLSFFIFATVGIVLTFFVGGMLIDPIWATGTTLEHGDEATYQAMQGGGQINWFVNLYYLIGIGSSILGAVIFGQSVVKRVRQDRYVYR